MQGFSKRSVDVERATATNGQLYPSMQEDPKLRWAFIRKVYSILVIQLLIAFGIAFTMFIVKPIHDFMRGRNGMFVMIGLIVVTLILLILMHCISNRHPWNYILLFLFTISMGAMVGAVATHRKADALLLAAGLTLLVAVGLTLFTFWAAKRGMDFQFLWPFLFIACLLLMCFGLLRILLPRGGLLSQVIGCFGALVFSAFIIYDTDNLIKRYNYDEYIDAAATLFVDVISLFLQILSIIDDGR